MAKKDDKIARQIQSSSYFIVGSLWLILAVITENWFWYLPAFANFVFMVLD